MFKVPQVKLKVKNLRVFVGMFLLLITSFTAIRATSQVEDPAVLGEYSTSSFVVDVVDGDTLVVETEGETNTVRLLGIDTPELKHPRKEIECFAKEASEKAKDLLLEEEVFLRPDFTQQDEDRYGRLLRYVYLADGTLVNELLIREGYAYEYTYRAPYKKQSEFQNAESEARENEVGLWAGTCL